MLHQSSIRVFIILAFIIGILARPSMFYCAVCLFLFFLIVVIFVIYWKAFISYSPRMVVVTVVVDGFIDGSDENVDSGDRERFLA